MTQETTTAWKGIAIILVVLGHLNIIPIGGQIGVIIFLVLSGYGLSASYDKNGLNHFWYKRIHGVWVPYVIWECLIALILFIEGSPKVNSIIQVALSALALRPASVLDAQWYVTYIFLVYAAFYLVRKRNLSFVWSVVFMSACGVLLGVLSLVDIIPRFAGAWYYSFCFAIGMLSYKYRSIKIPKAYIAVLGISCVLLYCALLCMEDITGYLSIMVFSQVFAVFVAGLMLLRGLKIKLLCFVGSHSYWVFLCNTFIISKVKQSLAFYHLEFTVPCKIVVFILIIILGVLLNTCYSFCERKVTKLKQKNVAA